MVSTGMRKARKSGQRGSSEVSASLKANDVATSEGKNGEPEANRLVPSDLMLPPYEVFMEQLRIEDAADGALVAMPLAALKALLTLAAGATPLNAHVYAEFNPDVSTDEARRHFVAHGYFEGRKTDWNVVDDVYYSARYPDVAQGLDNGHFPSAQSHFNNNGAKELRVPRADMEAVVGFWQQALAKPKN